MSELSFTDIPEVRAFAKKKLKLAPVPQKFTSTKKLKITVKPEIKRRYALIKEEIKRFYKNPAVSRVLPHKRYATKWGPGYILVMTLRNAYKAYSDHTGRKVCFSTFASLRPRNVRKLGSIPLDTCLCVTCTNVKLKIDALNKILGHEKAIVPETKLLSFLICPYQGKWPKITCVSVESGKKQKVVADEFQIPANSVSTITKHKEHNGQ
ncbi:hypothetical protein ElyMa_001142900 [Elysia marginata]|uniref:Uncharacterized protein n=1 Tax=Elysia marginata TaxID=1093978 RepID=A0AAV4HZV8_9GAST|nr:hypothetical protein ElyMa_001142900 [Elysia marginata]